MFIVHYAFHANKNFNALCLPKIAANLPKKSTNTIVLAWGDGILLNWIRTKKNGNQWKPLLKFSIIIKTTYMHIDSAFIKILCIREDDRREWEERSMRIVNSYAKICLLSRCAKLHCGCRRSFFRFLCHFAINWPYFYIFCNSSTFCGFNSMALFSHWVVCGSAAVLHL